MKKLITANDIREAHARGEQAMSVVLRASIITPEAREVADLLGFTITECDESIPVTASVPASVPADKTESQRIRETIIAQLHQRLADDAINETLIRYVADRLGHDRRYGIDPQKIKDELGWYPETPFEEGIVKTIDWYLAHEEWMANVTSGNYQKYYESMYKNK